MKLKRRKDAAYAGLTQNKTRPPTGQFDFRQTCGLRQRTFNLLELLLVFALVEQTLGAQGDNVLQFVSQRLAAFGFSPMALRLAILAIMVFQFLLLKQGNSGLWHPNCNRVNFG